MINTFVASFLCQCDAHYALNANIQRQRHISQRAPSGFMHCINHSAETISLFSQQLQALIAQVLT